MTGLEIAGALEREEPTIVGGRRHRLDYEALVIASVDAVDDAPAEPLPDTV